MAHTVKKNIWWYSAPDGVAPEVRANQQMTASQGILIPNTPMYLSTAGTWKVATDSDGTDIVQGLLVGLQNPTTTWPLTATTTTGECRILIIDAADTFAIYCETNDTDTAATQAMVGDEYGITVSATASEVGYTTMDINNANATVAVASVMGIAEPSKYDLTTAPGVALVKFLPAVINTTSS